MMVLIRKENKKKCPLRWSKNGMRPRHLWVRLCQHNNIISPHLRPFPLDNGSIAPSRSSWASFLLFTPLSSHVFLDECSHCLEGRGSSAIAIRSESEGPCHMGTEWMMRLNLTFAFYRGVIDLYCLIVRAILCCLLFTNSIRSSERM